MAKASDNKLAVKLGSDGLPTEFQIFSNGANETSKGTFTFNAESAASVISSYQDQGNELVIDYEHQTAADPPIEAPAAARFKPEVRPTGLWATEIKWTPRAAEYLKGKEYMYFSPWFDHNEQGTITRLRNLALTNFPATKNMPMLIAAKASVTATNKEEIASMTEEIKKALADLMAAMQAEEVPEGEHMMGLLRAALAAFGDPSVMPPKDKVKPCTDPAPVAAPAEVAALAEVTALTGKSSTAEALGKIAAWKEASSQVASLSARVAELETEKLGREFDSAIEEGKKAGKITPAMLSGKFISGLRSAGTPGIAQLRAYLEEAPIVIKTTETKQPETSEPVTLSADEEHYARLQGIDLKDMISHKIRRNAERTGG